MPALAGPVLAGWLAEQVTWRWAFWLVPIVMLWPLIALRGVLSAHDGGTSSAGAGRRRVLPALAGASGLTCVQAALIRPGGLPLWAAVPLAVLGLGLLIPAARRLLPAGALRLGRGLPTSVVMRGLLAACFFSSEAFVPLALVELRGVSVTMAGLVLAVSSVGWVCGSAVQSRLPGSADRARYVQWGTALVAVALVSLPLCLVPALPPWICVFSWIVGAAGMGLCFPSINVQTLRLSPPAEQGVYSSALQISDAVLSALGLGVAGAIHAAAVAAGGAQAGTYTLMWLLAAGVAAASILVARRMSPGSSAAS